MDQKSVLSFDMHHHSLLSLHLSIWLHGNLKFGKCNSMYLQFTSHMLLCHHLCIAVHLFFSRRPFRSESQADNELRLFALFSYCIYHIMVMLQPSTACSHFSHTILCAYILRKRMLVPLPLRMIVIAIWRLWVTFGYTYDSSWRLTPLTKLARQPFPTFLRGPPSTHTPNPTHSMHTQTDSPFLPHIHHLGIALTVHF